MSEDRRPSPSRATVSLLGVAWYWPVLIGVLVVALVLTVGITVSRASSEQAAAQRLASEYTPPALPTLAPVVTFDQAVARLEDSARPWTLAVVGDSTGYGPDRWVDQFADLVSSQLDRQVVLHDWNDDAVAYDTAKLIGSGGATITIWNASAPGQGPGYSREHLRDMIPEGVDPDVIIVNHGHNVGPDIGQDMSGLMSGLRFRFPTASFAYTVQNPFLGDTPAVQVQRAADELAYAEQHTWRIIDVYDAFTSAPDLEALYEDDRHENERGGLLWARTVMKATGI